VINDSRRFPRVAIDKAAWFRLTANDTPVLTYTGPDPGFLTGNSFAVENASTRGQLILVAPSE